ncbi:MAG: ABC transporter substrate-binding protein [Cellulomonadaceae bacterium]|jgi:oligopeptide transport system substrate-binding protein|nr:ABC transporter substrate-binding protein [Cellulomonadaceae bacterium]
MKIQRIAGAAAFVAAGALVLSACAPGASDDNAAPATPGDINASGVVRVNGSEPQNPLIPANTMETGGGQVVNLIFSTLVNFEADGTPRNEVAESIETDDNIHWTITVEEGWTFSDGTPVLAENFVNAWDFAALASNVNQGAFLFEDIVGFDAENDVKLSEAGGLEVDADNDRVFHVTLNSAVSSFGIAIGHNAFSPLPDVAFEDMDAFGLNPIGNGPYQLVEWNHDQNIELEVREGFNGWRVPQNGGIDFVFFADTQATYLALLGGDIDVISFIPSQFIETYRDELAGIGGFGSEPVPSAVWQGFWIPFWMEHFQAGEEGQLRRQAISMAIDRQEIVDALFDGANTIAVDWTSPVIPGFSDSLEGNDVLTFNPDRAAELWAQADAISPFTGTFTLGVNAGGGHEEWAEAATNQIANNLGIDTAVQSFPTFAVFLEETQSGEQNIAFRTGWQGQYPSIEYFLRPIYRTGAGSNSGQYTNPEFDAKLDAALQADSEDESIANFQAAQEILLQDLPTIPLWYGNARGGHGPNVDNVTFAWNTVPVFFEITVNN